MKIPSYQTHVTCRAWIPLLGILLAWTQASCPADAQVLAHGRGYTEGTIFVRDTLYFVDFSSSDVLRLAGNKVESVWHRKGCGPSGLVSVPQGLLVACYSANAVVLISLNGKVLQTIKSDSAGQLFEGPNDLSADAKGGIYFSASGTDKVLGKIFYRTSNGRVREVAGNIQYANGLVVSPDQKLLYVAESSSYRLLVYAIAPDGSLGPQKEFVKLGDILKAGRTYTPDGVRIDQHGRLFVGLYDGGGFAVINPQGRLIRQVDIAGPHHANLAISPDGQFVYGTTAYEDPTGHNDPAKRPGELYRVPNPVRE